MQRKIKALLAAVPPLLFLLVFYALTNWETILDGVQAVGGFLGSIQGQVSTLLTTVGLGFGFYKKFQQSNLPKTFKQLFGMKGTLRVVEFLNALLERFSLPEVIMLLQNADVMSADMQRAVQDISIALYGPKKQAPIVVPKPKAPRQARQDLANRVAEQLRLLGKRVEVAVEETKMAPKDPKQLWDKVLGKFKKPTEDAKQRKQADLKRLQDQLRLSKERLAQVFQGEKEG